MRILARGSIGHVAVWAGLLPADQAQAATDANASAKKKPKRGKRGKRGPRGPKGATGALSDAVADISDASQSNPYLVRVDAGRIAMPSALILAPYIALEGSGVNATFQHP